MLQQVHPSRSTIAFDRGIRGRGRKQQTPQDHSNSRANREPGVKFRREEKEQKRQEAKEAEQVENETLPTKLAEGDEKRANVKIVNSKEAH